MKPLYLILCILAAPVAMLLVVVILLASSSPHENPDEGREKEYY